MSAALTRARALANRKGAATTQAAPAAAPANDAPLGTAVTPVQTSTAAAGSAFELGWQMAQLFGPLVVADDAPTSDGLTDADSLPTSQRRDLAVAAVSACLNRLDLPPLGEGQPRKIAGLEQAKTELKELNIATIRELSQADPKLLSAYEVGLLLSGVCWTPADADKGKEAACKLIERFDRSHLGALQSRLASAGPRLPNQAAAVVGHSLHNWQAWIDANNGTLKRHWDTQGSLVTAALREQGESWRGLLSGDINAAADPGVNGWIQAGESVLRTAHEIFRRVLNRFWPVLVATLATVGFLLYASVTYASGTARVWASLITVAGGVGVTGSGVKSAGQKVAKVIENSVASSAQTEARAWAATTLPATRVGLVRRNRLHRAGVASPSSGLRLQDRPHARPRKRP